MQRALVVIVPSCLPIPAHASSKASEIIFIVREVFLFVDHSSFDLRARSIGNAWAVECDADGVHGHGMERSAGILQ